MDAIDLESENEGMRGHIEELDEEEDGLEDLDEDVESTTDETGNDSDTDTDSDGGSSEVDLESEYDNIEDVDHTDGPTGLEDTKASTLSTSMTLGVYKKLFLFVCVFVVHLLECLCDGWTRWKYPSPPM